MRNTQSCEREKVFPLFYERESRNGNLSHEYEVKRDGFKRAPCHCFAVVVKKMRCKQDALRRSVHKTGCRFPLAGSRGDFGIKM